MSALRGIPQEHAGVPIIPKVADFTHAALPKDLDGVLMANALHYVDGPETIPLRILEVLVPGGLFLVVEYDIDAPVPHWVPHPISAERMAVLLARCGFSAMMPLAHQPSKYGQGDLYTVFARRIASSAPG